jgi:hypothetical protein
VAMTDRSDRPSRVPTAGRKLCLHCGRHVAGRPRGLCWGCYQDPMVRDSYSTSGSKFARRGEGTGRCREPDPPGEPTAAIPGTEGKLAALEARVAAGRGLWHPDDAGWGGPG